MGFFYKAGGGDGVTVVERASFDALAISAKTQPHEQLMLDTSTGFYYKNWKTGGPGIPVPVQYFDDVTGYASSGTGNTGYFVPSDTLADAVGRGWVKLEISGGTVTKTAGNALTLASTTTTGSEAALQFQYSSAPYAADRVIVITTIESFTPAIAQSPTFNDFRGSYCHFRPNDGTNVYSQFCTFNHDDYPATINIGADIRGGSTQLGIGDLQSFTSGSFYAVTEISTSRSISVAQDLSKTRVTALNREGALIFASSVGYPAQFSVRVMDQLSPPQPPIAATFKITECHCLEMS